VCFEGAPVTIIESFATGTPVIGSRLGAMQEMIEHNGNGLLFETANPKALKEALQSFNTQNGQQDYSLYYGARETYLASYHPDQCYAAVINIYEEAIKSKKEPSNGQ
jgi:glycosyltransferase involved in cell wall biosynthesis